MIFNIKRLIQSATIRRLHYHQKHWRYHQIHMKKAHKILMCIERYKGKLSSHNVKTCKQYAVDVFGHKHFAAWLYVYTALSGKFKEGWIPDNYYGSIVVPKMNGAYGEISSLKPLNMAIFDSNTFPDLASYANGVFFDTIYRRVAPEAVKEMIFDNCEKVVFKLDNSLQGKGIHIFNKDSFNVKYICQLGNGLIQEFIEQHSIFNELQSNSVATIRITTIYEDSGEVSVRACYLRLGGGFETHVQSASHIRVPIDIENGMFADCGYTIDWIDIKSHPISKVEFRKKVIPAFSKCIHIVTQLHKKVPYARCVGWDVVVDLNENVKVMEWNSGHNDIKFSEATQGPCFADLRWENLKG